MSDLSQEAIQTLVALGAGGEPQVASKNATVPYALVPEGFHLEDLSKFIFNEHQAAPERIKQTVSVLDPESFIEYYTLFSDENSRVFAYEPDCSVKAVLDYHGAKGPEVGSPRWGQHKLVLGLRKSVEWERWNGHNNKKIPQLEFAEFLEQNGFDISTPGPAAMMEVARDLQGTTEVEFGSGVRLANGSVVLKYSETTKGTVGSSQITVPDRFTLSVPVFIGGDRISMEALLRYRVNGGHLIFWFTLVRPEEVLRQAFIAARDKIANDLEITIVNGQPS
jgi:uncharacterized protein YfdQ (DUF2303 family)